MRTAPVVLRRGRPRDLMTLGWGHFVVLGAGLCLLATIVLLASLV